VREHGRAAARYDDFVTEAGLLGLAGRVDGVSVGKGRLVGEPQRAASDVAATTNGEVLVGGELVDAAHSAGLRVYTWTLRPENRFLSRNFRRGSARSAFGDWLAEFSLIIGTGVDGIFVDHPDLGVEARTVTAAA
jgi:glycerophosphoryl diester phosphodiesterase